MILTYCLYFQIGVIAAVGLVDLVCGQIGPAPPRLNIPGAISVPYQQQQQYRSDKQVPQRVRRPVLRKQSPLIQPALASRSFDEKPVTEPPEEEVINTFIPNILQPQQPYTQTTIFSNDPIHSNTIVNPSPNTLITDALESLQQEFNLGRFPDRHQSQVQPSPTPPQPQFIQRPSSTALPLPTDFPGFSGVQRFAIDRNSRPQIQPQIQPQQSQPQPQHLIRRPHKPQPQQQQYDNYPEQAPVQVSRAPPARIHHNPHKEVYQRPVEHNSLNAIQDTKKKPVAQIIRKYRDEHEDGTITWGYENDDGSFKEEIIGMDCITR